MMTTMKNIKNFNDIYQRGFDHGGYSMIPDDNIQ